MKVDVKLCPGNDFAEVVSSVLKESKVNPIFAGLIGCLAIWVAYRQWRTADDRFRLDLFDKRFAVYEATRAFLRSVLGAGKVEDEKLTEFVLATREAEWLFGIEVSAFITDKIHNQAIELQTLNLELPDMPVGDERSANVREQAQIKKAMYADLDRLRKLCTPYLRITEEVD